MVIKNHYEDAENYFKKNYDAEKIKRKTNYQLSPNYVAIETQNLFFVRSSPWTNKFVLKRTFKNFF